MIHKCWSFLFGGYNADEMREQAAQNDAWDKMQSEVYQRKTGLSNAVIMHMMSETTYMTGREAKEKGFVDELLEDAEPTNIAASADGRMLFVHGRQMHLAPGMFAPDNKIVIFPVFALIYMIQFAYQPVMTALCFEYQKAGCPIFYGLARGLGSASFAVTSALIGGLVEKSGVTILLWVNIVAMALSALLIWTFTKPRASSPESTENAPAPQVSAHNNLLDFARTYPAFTLFLIASICFFFAHNMINDFMIQIIRNLGGGERQLGYANFLQAILELPVMALSGMILKKIRAKTLLIFSGVAFLVKILILVFANGMPMMYLSQSVQLFAYAVFIPAAAYYVSSTMEDLDQVKGQAFVTSAITLGGVFSNLVSGVILDHLGMRPMLLTGSVVCAIGVVIGFVAMTKLPHHRGSQN